jgi:hypothetical protein
MMGFCLLFLYSGHFKAKQIFSRRKVDVQLCCQFAAAQQTSRLRAHAAFAMGLKQTLDAMNVKVCGADKANIDFKKF